MENLRPSGFPVVRDAVGGVAADAAGTMDSPAALTAVVTERALQDAIEAGGARNTRASLLEPTEPHIIDAPH
jgi:hypothetical protein